MKIVIKNLRLQFLSESRLYPKIHLSQMAVSLLHTAQLGVEHLEQFFWVEEIVTSCHPTLHPIHLFKSDGSHLWQGSAHS
jgi:hypothetical protein